MSTERRNAGQGEGGTVVITCALDTLVATHVYTSTVKRDDTEVCEQAPSSPC